jgi:hypothetical protein
VHLRVPWTPNCTRDPLLHTVEAPANLALGRAPDAAGASFWAPAVRTGDRRFVLAALTASDEFFALSTAGCASLAQPTRASASRKADAGTRERGVSGLPRDGPQLRFLVGVNDVRELRPDQHEERA